MKILYECGDVFKAEGGDYYIVSCISNNNYTFINLFTGCNYDSDMQGDEEYITESVKVEEFEYVGNAINVVSVEEDVEE